MNQQHSTASGRMSLTFVDIVPESNKPISRLFLKWKLRNAGIYTKFAFLMQGGNSKYVTFVFEKEPSVDEKYRLANLYGSLRS